MYGRDFLTASAEGDFFSQVLFQFIEAFASKTSSEEAFAIVHCQPEGDYQRRKILFASADALAAFERAWRDALQTQAARTLAA